MVLRAAHLLGMSASDPRARLGTLQYFEMLTTAKISGPWPWTSRFCKASERNSRCDPANVMNETFLKLDTARTSSD